MDRLTDDDVQLVHEIIEATECRYGPELGPGLFAVYDEMIERQKVETARERRCFQLILQMLAWDSDESNMFKRFQHVLSEIGIEVDRDNALDTRPDTSEPFTSRTLMDQKEKSREEELLRKHLRLWRKNARTQRQFNAMQLRAKEHLELSLMFKVFNHWRVITSLRREKAAAAERHMIRFRCFNEWMEITVEEQRKIDLFQLKKFCTIWFERTIGSKALEVYAGEVYRTKLLRRTMRLWLLNFCDRRASLWKSEEKMRKAVDVWVTRTEDFKAREQYIDKILRPQKLEKTYFKTWLALTEDVMIMKEEARSFQKQHLLRTTFETWHEATIFKPKLDNFLQQRDQRTASKGFAVLQSQAADSRQARAFHGRHVVQDAFRTWRLELRCTYVIEDIDLRIKSQYLYRWSLATRLSLFSRKLGTRLMRETLATLQRKRANFTALKRYYDANQCRVLLLKVLYEWRSHLFDSGQADSMAAEFRRTKLLARSMQLWTDYSHHLRYLDAQANAAQFYVFTKSTIKTWEDAKVESQRQRRRHAFAYLRRKVKQRIVKWAFQKWRDGTFKIRAMELIAREKAEDRSFKLIFDGLASLRAKVRSVHEQNAQALMHWGHVLLVKTVNTWKEKISELYGLKQMAMALRATSVEKAASKTLGGMFRRVLQNKGQDSLATELSDRTDKKRTKSALRHWADRAAASREGTPGQMDAEASKEDPNDAQELYGGPTAAGLTLNPPLADRLNVDIGVVGGEAPSDGNAGITATPIPGYLRTPSRRLGRAKARDLLFSREPPTPSAVTPGHVANEVGFPATAPPAPSAAPFTPLGSKVTPFARKLRAQGYPGYRPPQDPLGNTTIAGRSGTRLPRFEDIAEEGP